MLKNSYRPPQIVFFLHSMTSNRFIFQQVPEKKFVFRRNDREEEDCNSLWCWKLLEFVLFTMLNGSEKEFCWFAFYFLFFTEMKLQENSIRIFSKLKKRAKNVFLENQFLNVWILQKGLGEKRRKSKQFSINSFNYTLWQKCRKLEFEQKKGGISQRKICTSNILKWSCRNGPFNKSKVSRLFRSKLTFPLGNRPFIRKNNSVIVTYSSQIRISLQDKPRGSYWVRESLILEHSACKKMSIFEGLFSVGTWG